MKKMEPPPWLSASHVPGFESLCDRLRASGIELSEADLLTVGRLAISEADLLQAERIAADCPLTVETKSNGEQPHPIFRRIRELRAEVRSWMRLLPRGSGGNSFPHAVPVVGPEVAGHVVGPDTEPPARVQKLRAMLKEFRASGGGAAGGAGGAETG